jgi:hypothetical protein
MMHNVVRNDDEDDDKDGDGGDDFAALSACSITCLKADSEVLNNVPMVDPSA